MKNRCFHVDDSDIASNASYTPRLTASFPKVELQKSFFSQPIIKPRNAGHKSSPRRVQFAPTNTENDAGPHVRDSQEDCRSSRNFQHQSNDSVSSDSLIVRGSVPRASGICHPRSVSFNESADKRLDELITNGLTNGAPIPVKGDVQNIRCLSPPPLPPRQGREVPSKVAPDLPPKHGENSQLTSTSSSTSVQNEGPRTQLILNGESHESADDDSGEYVFTKDLLVNLNKQILDTQQQHRMATRPQSTPSSPREDDVCKYASNL